MITVEKYGVFELRFIGSSSSAASFMHSGQEFAVKAFPISDTEMAVRFMPNSEGQWLYTIATGEQDLAGEFTCVPASPANHGPVSASGQGGFAYADGKVYIPVGTTCYAWIHQGEEMVKQTLATLAGAPFNKLRMCVFPKSMPYNNNEPDLFPFYKNESGAWDVSRPVHAFWDHLDDCILKLAELGIETDLILYHPYDRWGFAQLSLDDCLTYLDYCLCRLSAHRNIWWSLANEYDMVFARSNEDWDIIGQSIQAGDPFGHLTSIHNWLTVYPRKEWMTHVSIQSGELRRIPEWQQKWQLPVIIDECGYEGNIEFEWGNLTAFEMVNRFWTCAARGSYCTHGETFWREDEALWWAKGGQLYGQSPERIKFLRSIQEEAGVLKPMTRQLNLDPNNAAAAEAMEKYKTFFKAIMALSEEERNRVMLGMQPMIASNIDCRLQYLARACAVFAEVNLPENGQYRVEVIDVWEMKRTVAFDAANGLTKVPLPGKEGMAILVSRLSGDNL